ncbi:MAG: CopG family transcriptional regulator [Chloroflexota bacterium]
MASQRLEVRLDAAYRRKLDDLAAARGTSVSQIVREMIDAAYQEADREQRLRAAIELGQMEIEDVPDPETLSKQLNATHDLAGLY